MYCLRILLGLFVVGFVRGKLRVGAGSRIIPPDLEKHAPVFRAGFGHNRRATAVHDDLYARCLAIQPGKTPLVICGVDSIGLFWEDAARIRQAVKGDLVVAALHDHEAPDTMGLWGASPVPTLTTEDSTPFLVHRTA